MKTGIGDKTVILDSSKEDMRSIGPIPDRLQHVLSSQNPDQNISTWANPLVMCAQSTLSLVSKLRQLPFHDKVDELQERLVHEMANYEDRALQAGAAQKEVLIGRYFVCALMDETVLNTPWGSHSSWSQQSLLSRFYTEAWGGENFFLILERLMKQPGQQLNLLELAYICLSLGFEGKYRVEGGRDSQRAIEQLRNELYSIVQGARDEPERDLSVHWKGLSDRRNPLRRYFPLWALVLILGSMSIITYLSFSFAASKSSDRIYNQLVSLAQEKIDLPKSAQPIDVPASSAPPSKPVDMGPLARFQKLLSHEMAQGLVEVIEGPVVRIPNAFPSGSEQIKAGYRPMLMKLAKELLSCNSRILVVGHTDNQPLRLSARFKSNWQLSVARAENVVGVMTGSAPLGKRISSEGRSDQDPIFENDTEAHRALNRRIDIHIW